MSAPIDVKLVGKECKFAVHLPAKEGLREDCHFIKETLHYSDGTKKPNFIRVLNFKRPFYITKKHFRKYNDKKEYESLDKLNRHLATQSDLPKEVGKQLGSYRWKSFTNRDVKTSKDAQYVYGTDVTSTVILKSIYKKKWDLISDSKLAVLDIETDIDTDEIKLITVATYDKVFTVINRRLTNKLNMSDADLYKKLKKMYKEFIPESMIKEMLKSNRDMIVDDELGCIAESFKELNDWMPDIVAIWNLNFDIPRIMERLAKYDVNPKDILTDLRVPKEYRFFKYVKGKESKLMASGKFGTLPPQKQWHHAIGSMSFQLLDAMSSYNYIREGQPEVIGGYGLDNILKKNTKHQKLKLETNTRFQNADWHKMMVDKHPLEYTIYNKWDCMGMLELDMKTGDLARQISIFSGINDLGYFNSGPTKIATNLYFEYLKYGVVIGTGGKKQDEEEDERMSLSNWIAVLDAYRIIPDGLKIILEDEDLMTNIYAFVYDIDAVSSYPSNIRAANVSKATRITEVIKIEGIEVEEMKMVNINLISGPSNALGYTNIMFGIPDLDYWDDI